VLGRTIVSSLGVRLPAGIVRRFGIHGGGEGGGMTRAHDGRQPGPELLGAGRKEPLGGVDIFGAASVSSDGDIGQS
jgi:hypothetical protein